MLSYAFRVTVHNCLYVRLSCICSRLFSDTVSRNLKNLLDSKASITFSVVRISKKKTLKIQKLARTLGKQLAFKCRYLGERYCMSAEGYRSEQVVAQNKKKVSCRLEIFNAIINLITSLFYTFIKNNNFNS